MSSDFIDTIQRAIRGQYHLRRGERKWILEEDASKVRIHIHVPIERSIAFSLDRKPKPFTFFADNPPPDFAKMCDAVLFYLHGNKTYLFVIEIKTGDPGECEKQLINGKLFCNWLINLYIQHKSLNPCVTVIPLLIWKPRENPGRKGTTTHRGNDDSIQEMPLRQFDERGFEIRNRNTVPISELIKALGYPDE